MRRFVAENFLQMSHRIAWFRQKETILKIAESLLQISPGIACFGRKVATLQSSFCPAQRAGVLNLCVEKHLCPCVRASGCISNGFNVLTTFWKFLCSDRKIDQWSMLEKVFRSCKVFSNALDNFPIFFCKPCKASQAATSDLAALYLIFGL